MSPAPLQETRSTCPYCGVGCGVIIGSRGPVIESVRGDPDHPANRGRLCSKGQSLHLTADPLIAAGSRLLTPLRRPRRGAPFEVVDWNSALDAVSDSFASVVQRHGPDAVGFYVSGQLLTEDYYVFNKLAKGLIGTNNIDTNSRLCMSSAVAAYKMTLGADAPPTCYEDIQHTQCLFIAGSNTADAHPVLYRQIEEARAQRPDMTVIVVDPRRTDTAASADLHLAIQPGTDILLFHGMLHLMLWEGWTRPDYIAAHTEGFDALKDLVREYTPERVAQGCGIRTEDLHRAARRFATSTATLSLYCQGLNQSSSGTAKNAALINLHLATAQIGRAGAGPFSLTGQPNAMGGREVGGLANLLSAHRDLANPAHRAEVASLWGVQSVPERPGKTAVELFQAAADGEVKALWIACTNPAQSMPDQTTVRRALQRAEWVVLQDAFADTATAAFADVLLPATTWGEKEGTVTNSERRISRVRSAVPPAGLARHDWQIAVDVARRLEQRHGMHRSLTGVTLFPYDSPESIWLDHKNSTRGRDLDITGLSYALLEAMPQQWPCPEGQMFGRQRLYEDGQFCTPSTRARFAAVEYRPPAENRDARYPFSLNTGRLRDQWHGMSRTGRIGKLFQHVPEPVVQLHPQDMAQAHWQDGDLLHVSSRRGSLILPAQACTDLGRRQAFIPMHWGSETLSGRQNNGLAVAGVNALTQSAYCPQSKQPELKHSAVRILKAELPWRLIAVAWVSLSEQAAVLARLRECMTEFDFATCIPLGADQPGVLFRAAHSQAPDAELIDRLQTMLGLVGPQVLQYADPRRGQRRCLRLGKTAAGAQLDAFLLAGDTTAQDWLKDLLQEHAPMTMSGRQLLQSSARPPQEAPDRGHTVCSCVGVREPAIRDLLATASGSPVECLELLKSRLGCGTQCGSCVPELQRMVAHAPTSVGL